MQPLVRSRPIGGVTAHPAPQPASTAGDSDIPPVVARLDLAVGSGRADRVAAPSATVRIPALDARPPVAAPLPLLSARSVTTAVQRAAAPSAGDRSIPPARQLHAVPAGAAGGLLPPAGVVGGGAASYPPAGAPVVTVARQPVGHRLEPRPDRRLPTALPVTTQRSTVAPPGASPTASSAPQAGWADPIRRTVAAGTASWAPDGALVFVPPTGYHDESPSDAPDEAAVQRQVAGDTTAGAAAAPPSGEGPSVSAPGGGAGPGAGAAPGGQSNEQLEQLAKNLYDKIRERLKVELRLDRERSGRLTDLSG